MTFIKATSSAFFGSVNNFIITPMDKNKICIIGAGTAGLAAELSLRKMGLKGEIYERLEKWGPGVLGFILLPNGLKALDRVGLGEQVRERGQVISEFVMISENGKEIYKQPLEEAFGIKRNRFLETLREAVPANAIHSGINFSKFEYDRSGKAVAATFQGGERVEASLFLGCDGVRSSVRKQLYPKYTCEKFRVKEMICLVHEPQIARFLGSSFVKAQYSKGGLAFGMVRCSPEEVIWYMQFDSVRWPFEGTTAEAKKKFVKSLVGEWDEPIPSLLDKSDFYHTHLWTMPDMEPLPQYFYKNVALVGDAAHIFLPFTSQGVNSALHDAIHLAEHLAEAIDKKEDFEATLKRYSREHKKMVEKYVQSGKNLAERFLFPKKFHHIAIPLAK